VSHRKHHRPGRRARVAGPPAVDTTVADLAAEIDQFTDQTRDPDWCEALAERLHPLVARRTSTDAVIEDVRAWRRHSQQALADPDRMLVLCGLVDQLAHAYARADVRRVYSLYVTIAAAAVAGAENLTTTFPLALDQDVFDVREATSG
jgi:hypothetical protein